jgi:hypothetical protein
LNKKVLFGTAILATVLIIAMVSSIPTALAVFQANQNSETQLYPMHMGQWGYMPHQYGPYDGHQGQEWGHYVGGGCPGMNYGYNTPYGEEYPQPSSWNYTN